MPKSLTISLAAALIGVAVYYFWTFGNGVTETQNDFIAVAVNFFNISAIFCLFFILATCEKSSAEEFGGVMRDNISTIVVALFINVIMTGYDLLLKFNLLTP